MIVVRFLARRLDGGASRRVVVGGWSGGGRFTTPALAALALELRREPRRGLVNAQRISYPVLVIDDRADLACTPSHTQRPFDAVATVDRK